MDNWKGRQPMLLQTIPIDQNLNDEYFDLIEKCKSGGTVITYIIEDFQWVFNIFS